MPSAAAPSAVPGRVVPLAAYLQRLVWMAMLPLLLLAVWMAQDAIHGLQASEAQLARQSAEQLAGAVDELLRRHILAQRLLASSPLLDGPSLADFHQRAQALRPQWDSTLILADAQGRMLMHSGRPFGTPLPSLPRPPDGGRAAAPAALASGAPVVGDLVLGPVIGRPLIAVAVPVRRSGQPDRVLLTTIEADRFAPLLRRPGMPDDWRVSLLDSLRQPIAGPAVPKSPGGATSAGGAPSVTVQTLAEAPWQLVLQVPPTRRHAALWRAALVLAGAIVAATVVGVVAGGIGGRRLRGAVTGLTEASPPTTGGVAIREIEAARRTLALDASARQQALQSLSEAHGRFAAVFANAPVAMAVGPLADARIAEVNHAFEALTGYPGAEVVGRSSAELGLWAEAAFRAQALEQLRGDGLVPALLTQMRRRDGQLLDVTFSACRVEIGGQPQFVAMFVDTTAQQQVQRALQRQQQELEALVAQRTAELAAANASLSERAAAIAELYDNAPCGYHSLSRDGRYTAVNSTELAMLGYTRDELLGRSVADLMSTEDAARLPARLAQLRQQGQLADIEIDMRRKDGNLLPVLVSAALVCDAQGRSTGYRATMVDNSERKARERQIVAMQAELARRASEAEAANRAKSAFLANMSHEIRTPMNAIIGLTHLMARDAREPLQQERLGKVNGAAEHLLQVINDILDLSKIEAGKLVLEDIGFDLGELLHQVLQMVEQPARQKGLALALDRLPGADGQAMPARLRGDPTRLSQALINLLANAVKFTERGGVRLEVRPLQQDDGGVLLRLAVHDSGPGIDAAALPHLFDAFEQADTSISRRHGGTGLGLALTRHIARLMGGEVGVRSEPGQGSSFWFTARLSLDAAPSAAPVADAPGVAGDTGTTVPAAGGPNEQRLRQQHRGQRILLAEDNPINREVAVELLRAAGLQVDTAEDGRQAVDQLRAGHHDLVLMDMQMPGVDGLEATRLLRAGGHAAVPIVAMTANAFGEDRALCLAAGMDDHVAKPVNPERLYAALLRWLPPVRQPSGGAVDGPPEVAVGAAATTTAATVTTTSPWRDRLAAVDGLDSGLALDLVGGDVRLLQRVLARFVSTYRAPAVPAPALDAAQAHGLRGACSAIGAVDLAAALQRYETGVRQVPPAPDGAARAGEIGLRLQRLVDQLAQVLDGAPTAALAHPT